VYERAAQSQRASAVFVATDDDRIADHVRSFGGRVVMPPGDHQSGTDRIAASLSFFDEPYEYVVNVVTAVDGDALYFSRAPIPFGSRSIAQRHIGLYGYRAAVLRALAMLPPSSLERAESLEQLRALQNGFKIRVVQTDKPHLGVDRPEDVARVESELAKHA